MSAYADEFDQRAGRVVAEARVAAEQVTTWADFSNRMFSPWGGLVAETFPDEGERKWFYNSEHYKILSGLQLALMKKFGVREGATPREPIPQPPLDVVLKNSVPT